MKGSMITYPPEGTEPIGVIEIIHGMCEHKGRYEDTMKEFSKRGFICAITDLRGHGENVLTEDDYGFFGEDGYKGLTDDVENFTMYLRREFPKLPLILLGHSMGSLIALSFIKKRSRNIDALVLSGLPAMKPGVGAGKFLAKVIKFFKGEKYRSPLITKLVFGPFERAFKKEGILNAWLCSDRDVVDEYNADPKCGFYFTINGYLTLFNLMSSVYSKQGWRFKELELPIMFASGAEDPCRVNDTAFKKSVNFIRHRRFRNVVYRLYEDMRHEIFQEPRNKEVFDDIVKYLKVKGPLRDQDTLDDIE